ncbi:MAG: glycosyltransferase [Rhodospirillaceae bacterium]|nr:glycosyltransferase [Rhodospirillaceae bacterium]
MTVNVLIVGERWCDAAPGGSLSNLNHNIIGSLETTGLASISTLFLNETVAAGHPVDQAILDAVAASPPDLLYLTPLPGHPINPKPKTLQLVRMKYGVPVCAMYWDSALPGQVKFADQFGDAVDFNIAIDCYTVYPQVSTRPDAYLPLWTPQDPRVFYRDDTPRDIGLSFIGSTARYADREGALAGLAQAGIAVTKSGGQREQRLSIEDYAAMLRRSKVTLNFSKVFAPEVPSHQFKGRVLESMLCGALLLEPNNLQTQRWFTAGVEYDTFGTMEELVEKATFYLENEQERLAMTQRAAAKAETALSAHAFWTAVFARANLAGFTDSTEASP